MRPSLATLLLAAALLAAAPACNRRAAPESAAALPRPLPLSVLADSAPDVSLRPSRLSAVPSPSRLTLLRVTRSRAGAEPPLPVPEAEAPPASDEARERLPLDDTLRPPLPLGETKLRLPRARSGVVELDVRVDEEGIVTDAQPVAESADTALVEAAIEAAMRVRYRPATISGRPIAVWCRQRFEIGR